MSGSGYGAVGGGIYSFGGSITFGGSVTVKNNAAAAPGVTLNALLVAAVNPVALAPSV